MATTLTEQARQSDLVLLDDEWNSNNWPPLRSGWHYASVVVNHCSTDTPDHTNSPSSSRAQSVVVLGGQGPIQSSSKSVLVLNLEESNKQ